MKKEKVTLQYALHRNQIVVQFLFSYHHHLIKVVKTLGCSWSKTLKSWYIPIEKTQTEIIFQAFEGIALVDYTFLHKKYLPQPNKTLKEKLNEDQKEILTQFHLYLKGKRFSTSTVKTYTLLVAHFIIFKHDFKVISIRDIESYIEEIFVPKKISISTHRQFISGINHYLTFTNQGILFDFKKYAPKKDKKLPIVLSKEEIIRLIRVTKNLKHRVCITLLYSSGLRVGELLNLKVSSLDFDRHLLKVEMGKGRKDRYVPIAKSILPMLHNYLTTYSPKKHLIEGLNEQKYSPESIRSFLKRSCLRANINKHVTPHTLRHSYATHLLENGTDIRYIQELLGHSKPETTMIYTHVRSDDLKKINNPLDLIVEQLKNAKRIS